MEAAIFDDLSVVGDPIRSRMLVLLQGHELTVSELCAVLQLPQSTVSRHLKTLSDAEWVASRRDGTSRYYSSTEPPSVAARKLWSLLRDQVAATAAADQDARRMKSVMSRRHRASQEFFESGGGRWDKLREEMFGRWSHLHALGGLLDGSWKVGDLGCGTGHMSAAMAPFVAGVIAVDRSTDMLQATRSRVREWSNVEVRRGELEAPPIEDGTLDAATLMLVLHHASDPGAVLAAARRTLKPGGRLLIADMLAHDREEYRQQLGHVWLGFSEEQLRRLAAAGGFRTIRITPLEPDQQARGPALFVASATKN